VQGSICQWSKNQTDITFSKLSVFVPPEGTSLAIIVELINHFFSGTDPVYTQAKSLFAWMLDALSL
jgi:hypothetical protein